MFAEDADRVADREEEINLTREGWTEECQADGEGSQRCQPQVASTE